MLDQTKRLDKASQFETDWNEKINRDKTKPIVLNKHAGAVREKSKLNVVIIGQLGVTVDNEILLIPK